LVGFKEFLLPTIIKLKPLNKELIKMNIFSRSFIASYLLTAVIVPLSAHSSEKLEEPSVIILKM
jgi:hypothetical protein